MSRELVAGETRRLRWVTDPVPEFGDVLIWRSGLRRQVIDVRGKRTLIVIGMSDRDFELIEPDTHVWADCFWAPCRRAS